MKLTIKCLLVFASLLVIPAIYSSKLSITSAEEKYRAAVANLTQLQGQVERAHQTGAQSRELIARQAAENAQERSRVEILEREKKQLQEQLRKNARDLPSLTNINFLNRVVKQQKREQQRKSAGISSATTDDNTIYAESNFINLRGITNKRQRRFYDRLDELDQEQDKELFRIERLKLAGLLSELQYYALTKQLNAMHEQEESNFVRKEINLNKTAQPITPPTNPSYFTRLKNSCYQLFNRTR